MDFLYFLIWLIVALSVSFALIWLGLLLSSAKKTLDTVREEVVPVIRELDATLKNINTELERVENVFEKIDAFSGTLKKGIKQVEEVVSPGLGRIALFVRGLRSALNILFKDAK